MTHGANGIRLILSCQCMGTALEWTYVWTLLSLRNCFHSWLKVDIQIHLVIIQANHKERFKRNERNTGTRKRLNIEHQSRVKAKKSITHVRTCFMSLVYGYTWTKSDNLRLICRKCSFFLSECLSPLLFFRLCFPARQIACVSFIDTDVDLHFFFKKEST